MVRGRDGLEDEIEFSHYRARVKLVLIHPSTMADYQLNLGFGVGFVDSTRVLSRSAAASFRKFPGFSGTRI